LSDKPNLLEGLISEVEYCAQLGVCRRTAQRARRIGVAPPWVRIHRKVFYVIDKTLRDFADRTIEPVRKQSPHSPEARRIAP
jgi:hypothetical protein